MRIINQKRDRNYDDKGKTIVLAINNYIFIGKNNDISPYELGVYDSPKRAKEIFEEIITYQTNGQKIYSMPEE